MSSYKLLEIYRLIQAYNIPLNLNFQTVYKNPEKTLPRTRPRNNRNFLGNSAHPNAMGQFASPWPFTGWCGSNCILSPCLWLYLLEQYLYLKIWTTVQNIRRCFHIEFWEYFLVGLLADIMAIVPDGMYYAPGGGGYFRNFWMGMCRWEPGTLNLYQSYFSWILLPYTRVNSPNPPYPRVAVYLV